MAGALAEVLGRVVGGARRRVLSQPVLAPLLRRRRCSAVERHQEALPPLDATARQMLAALDREAVCHTDATTLGMDALLAGPQLAEAGVVLQQIVDADPSQSIVRLPRTGVEAHTALYLAGLSPRITDIVENYLKLPPVYLGVEFKVERADGREETVRRWHCDVEDERMVKLLVYLNDVDADGGGFEYLPAARTTALREKLRYRSGYLSDATAAAKLRPEVTQLCMGPRGTATLFDGVRLFHRAQPPRGKDRISLTYTYASRFLRQIMPGAKLDAATKHSMEGVLTPELLRFLP